MSLTTTTKIKEMQSNVASLRHICIFEISFNDDNISGSFCYFVILIMKFKG